MIGESAVDEYIATFPEGVRMRLETLRAHVIKHATGAVEGIGYGIPTYKLGKNIFHFAAHTHHIGLYPGPEALQAHLAELSSFKTTKGSIHIPHDEPLPLALVKRLIEFNLRTLAKPATKHRATKAKAT